MLGFLTSRRRTPVLEGGRVELRMPRNGDYREWAALRRESAEFLQPWEPLWSHDELERTSWQQRVRRYHHEFAMRNAVPLLIFDRQTQRLIGGITLGNIRYGVAQSGQIGYWLGERHAGQGYMKDAIETLLDHSFASLRLHRIEAACIPENRRSVRVLEKVGFQREGVLRSYLRINGSWEDHVLYAMLEHDFRAGRR